MLWNYDVLAARTSLQTFHVDMNDHWQQAHSQTYDL